MRFPTVFLASLLAFPLLAAPAPAGPAQDAELVALAGRARTAMGAGRFDEAAELYGRIVQALPEEPGMQLNLGMALSMAGHPEEALEHLETASRLKPGLAPASLFIGMAHMDLGQPGKAIGPLQDFLAVQPGHLEAKRMLADAFLLEGRFEEAARHFEALAEEAARHPGAWYGLGRAYEGMAGAAFETMQRQVPDSYLTTLLVAEAMVASGRDATAFRLFSEVLEERPDLAEVHEALAVIYDRRDHPEWARVERERARQIPPRECAPGSGSLECDFRAGRFDAVLHAATGKETAEALYWRSRAANQLARQAFTHLASLPPSPEATLVEVAVRRAQRQPPGESIEELTAAVEKWPGDQRLRLELIRTLFAAGETEQIRPLLEQQIARNADSTELLVLYAETWLRLLQPDKAVPLLEKALALEPALTSAQVALGRAYMETGQTERAIAPLKAALDTDTDGSIHFRLARAYRELGQAERSREIREQFQELEREATARARSREEEFRITAPPEQPPPSR